MVDVSKSSKDKNNSNHTLHPTKHKYHPLFLQRLNLGQKSADIIANIGGSWPFIFFLIGFLFLWIGVNIWLLSKDPFDPYPFILLNLMLSCVAAFQAPIILMSQNRQAERDRIDAKYDHAINRKAEREIQKIQQDLNKIRRMMGEMKKK